MSYLFLASISAVASNLEHPHRFLASSALLDNTRDAPHPRDAVSDDRSFSDDTRKALAFADKRKSSDSDSDTSSSTSQSDISSSTSQSDTSKRFGKKKIHRIITKTTTSTATTGTPASTTDSMSTKVSTGAPTTTDAGKSTDLSTTKSDDNDSPIHGFYQWSDDGRYNYENYNLAVAFTGWMYISQVQKQMRDDPNLSDWTGRTWFALGGDSAWWTKKALNDFVKNVGKINQARYSGVIFDVEVIEDAEPEDFARAFAAAKNAGFTVALTTSHTAPFDSNAKPTCDYTRAWLQDTNLDVLSPQNYGEGDEAPSSTEVTSPTSGADCPWSVWSDAVPTITPSIVTASKEMLKVVHKLYRDNGITISGYFVWQPDYYNSSNPKESKRDSKAAKKRNPKADDSNPIII